MKYILLTVFLFCCYISSFCQTPSGLARVSDNFLPPITFGWRLIQESLLNHGNIGGNAVDLSISPIASNTLGATGQSSFATGFLTTASGNRSTAMGSNTTASGYTCTAMGFLTTASGGRSTAMGNYTISSGYATTSIGSYNTIDGSANPTDFVLTNRAFVIGNGTNSSRSNAMTVLFDGSTTIAAELTVNSDARLKTNISTLGSTLSLLKLLDGKTYNLKSDRSSEKIGLMAQEVQKVFPQLVRKARDEQGTLSVNYQGLIPVLINAVNEQQVMIQKQDVAMNEQQLQIDYLTAMVASIIKDK